MITIHSPKFSTGKTEITKNSPTFRAKRAPSVTDSYSTQSMPKITSDSPSKLSADRKRKSHNDNAAASFTVKPVSKQKGTKEIIDSIQQLKQQYKSLKEAYRELIQQRLKNTHQIAKIRKENQQLQYQNQRIYRQSDKLKLQLNFLQQENDRTRREFFKLLQVQKFKAQKLEESLNEKQQYINQTLLKIRTQADETIVYPRNCSLIQMPQEDVSLTISQDKSIVIDRSINNQSQFLSFSLTSVLEESTDKELAQSKRKIEHAKAHSELPQVYHYEERRPKQMHNFKKHKKEYIPKLELTKIESKGNIMKTEGILRNGVQKRGSKGRVSKSFREKQNKQTLNHNCKKKSKKFINLSGINDI